jgi:rare lipoprotein A
MLTMASWYGAECAGKPMAGGGPFNPAALTCASWDYSFGTRLAVTHGTNVVVVTCTDRGPAKRLCAQGRRLDLSRAAFAALAPIEQGVIKVKIERIK